MEPQTHIKNMFFFIVWMAYFSFYSKTFLIWVFSSPLFFHNKPGLRIWSLMTIQKGLLPKRKKKKIKCVFCFFRNSYKLGLLGLCIIMKYTIFGFSCWLISPITLQILEQVMGSMFFFLFFYLCNIFI